jgi:hypothetical protein
MSAPTPPAPAPLAQPLADGLTRAQVDPFKARLAQRITA